MILTPRRLFILMGLIAAVAVIGLRGQALIDERARLLGQVEGEADAVAENIAAYLGRLYDGSGRVARQVSTYISAEDPAAEVLAAYLSQEAAETPADDYIVVLDDEGDVVATSEPEIRPGVGYGSATYREYVGAAEQRIEPALKSRLTGAVVYPLTHRTTGPDGEFSGVVGVNIRAPGVRPTAERAPDDVLLSAWTQDGGFITANFMDFNDTGGAIAPPPPYMLQAGGAEDSSVIEGSAAVQGWPIIVVASYDRHAVLAPWRRDLRENLMMIGGVLAALAVLVLFGVRTANREERAKQQFREASDTATAALRDRELLIKEVHHRVKNSLLMTSSLIHLQGQRFSDPEVREAFESTGRRLTSIGLVHEALYAGPDIKEVDLADYLPKLMDEIAIAHGADARGVDIELKAEPVRVSPDQATPVGLIVTEVVTNAFKHAFDGNGAGEIAIACGPADGDRVELTIRDNGRGHSGAKAGGRSGLGSRLIKALTQQLGGEMSYVKDGGTLFQLNFPRRAEDISPSEKAERKSPAADPVS